jgi:hypothetical protein
MVEIRQERAFAREPCFVFGSDTRFGGDDLQRDGTLRFEIEGSIDDPYRAAPDFSLDREAASELAPAGRRSFFVEHARRVPFNAPWPSAAARAVACSEAVPARTPRANESRIP